MIKSGLTIKNEKGDAMIKLKCPECGGSYKDETVKMTYDVKNVHVVIKNVPAKVCQKCGNELLDGHTAKDVDLLVNRVSEDVERFARSLALPGKRHSVSLAV